MNRMHLKREIVKLHWWSEDYLNHRNKTLNQPLLFDIVKLRGLMAEACLRAAKCILRILNYALD